VDESVSHERFLVSNKQMKMTPDPHCADSLYLYYLLSSPPMVSAVQARSIGSAVPGFNLGQLREFRVVVPSLVTQRRIAAVLAAFDELIAINKRRIEVLEDVARSLYREWFERSRHPSGTSNGSWTRRPASAIFTINPRLRAAQPVFDKVTMADVDERYGAVFPSAIVERASGSRFQQNDVLLARITPCLENGKTALVKFLDDDTVAVGSTEFIVLRGKSVGPAFTYCAARSDRLREHAIKSMTGASGRQRVSAVAFDSLELVEPPPSVASEFEARVGPLLDDAHERARQNRALAHARDLLLPRLVTGKLDISDMDLGDLLPEENAA
jgi:type I restriction enzyme S subunit